MSKICITLALSLLALQPIAKAGDADPATLAQIKQLASQGQDAQTASQVSQFVDQNQNLITTIIAGYLRYIKQVQAMADSNNTAPDATAQTTPATPAVQQLTTTEQPTTTQQPAITVQTSSDLQPSTTLQTSALQPSTALQTSAVQPSGGLRTSHLAGYPSLPDLVPLSSVTTLSAAQNAYAVKVEQENQARKQYLMQHPEGYTY